MKEDESRNQKECKRSKSVSCKGRGFNKESKSEKIIGWKNYYSTKTNETWMQELDWYIICTFYKMV